VIEGLAGMAGNFENLVCGNSSRRSAWTLDQHGLRCIAGRLGENRVGSPALSEASRRRFNPSKCVRKDTSGSKASDSPTDSRIKRCLKSPRVGGLDHTDERAGNESCPKINMFCHTTLPMGIY